MMFDLKGCLAMTGLALLAGFAIYAMGDKIMEWL
jgi:hypothetical protein